MISCCPLGLINLKFSAYKSLILIIIMLAKSFRSTTRLFSQQAQRLFVFAGQGTQQKGMLSCLLEIPQAKVEIQRQSSALNIDFIEICSSDTNKLLNRTKYTQPILVLSQVLAYRYLFEPKQAKVISKDYMIGHSIGEYSALCVAGSLSLEGALKLVRRRGQLMEQFTKQPSGMLIVRFSDENKTVVSAVVKDYDVEIASYNTPNTVLVAGPMHKLDQARDKFKQLKITCLSMPVSAAFHCRTLEPMRIPYSQYLQTVNFEAPNCNILRNLDTQIYRQASDIRQGLVKHLTNPVQFEQSIRRVDLNIESIEITSQTNLHNGVKKFVDETRKQMFKQKLLEMEKTIEK